MRPARERWLWRVGLALTILLVLWVLNVARSISVPLLLAFIFAYVFHPLLNVLQRKGISRTLASLVLVLVLGGLLVGGLIAVTPAVVRELAELPPRLLEAYRSFAEWVEQTFGLELPDTRGELEEEFGGLAAGDVAPVLRWIYGGAAGALGIAAGLALLPVISFFLLRDLDKIFFWFEELIPPRQRSGALERFGELDRAVGGFIRGQIIVSLIMAVLYSLGFWIVGLPLAIGVGVVAGLGNLIPYLGTAFGILVATILAILSGEGLTLLLGVYVVIAAVQAVESTLLTPKIVGQATGLSPLGVIIAVLLFGSLFGFIGLLLAVPLASVAQLLARIGLFHYRRSPAYRG